MKCNKCQEDLPVDDFGLEAGYRRKTCKVCRSTAIRKANDKVRAAKRDWIEDYKRLNPCQVCGETRPYVLDFHHRDPSKKFKAISRLLVEGSGISKLVEEVEKCDVLCANCHRELHYLENIPS